MKQNAYGINPMPTPETLTIEQYLQMVLQARFQEDNPHKRGWLTRHYKAVASDLEELEYMYMLPSYTDRYHK